MNFKELDKKQIALIAGVVVVIAAVGVTQIFAGRSTPAKDEKKPTAEIVMKEPIVQGDSITDESENMKAVEGSWGRDLSVTDWELYSFESDGGLTYTTFTGGIEETKNGTFKIERGVLTINVDGKDTEHSYSINDGNIALGDAVYVKNYVKTPTETTPTEAIPTEAVLDMGI